MNLFIYNPDSHFKREYTKCCLQDHDPELISRLYDINSDIRNYLITAP